MFGQDQKSKVVKSKVRQDSSGTVFDDMGQKVPVIGSTVNRINEALAAANAEREKQEKAKANAAKAKVEPKRTAYTCGC